MRSMDSPSSQIPAFLSKLWTLLDNESTQDLIRWDEGGTSFHVFDHARFSKEVLPQYFKHNNMASFVRQLNMYGFRKISSIEQGALRNDKDDMEFHNPFFLKDNPALLDMIKRKTTRERMSGEDARISDIDRVVSDVWEMRSKQDSVTNKLQMLKKENEALWREVASLRQKHSQQQQIVNKIIQFLVAVAGARRSGLKRSAHLMIEDVEKAPSGAGSKRRKLERPVQHLPASPPSYSVTSPATATTSPTSAVTSTSSPRPAAAAGVLAGSSQRSPKEDPATDTVKDPLAVVGDIFADLGKDDTDSPLTPVGDTLSDDAWHSMLALDKVPSPSRQPSPVDKDGLSDSLNVLQHDIDGLRDIFAQPSCLDFLSSSPYSLEPGYLLGTFYDCLQLFNPEAPEVPVLPDRVSGATNELEDPAFIKGNELIEYHPAEELGLMSGVLFDDLDNLTETRSSSAGPSSSTVRAAIESNIDEDADRNPVVSSNDLD